MGKDHCWKAKSAFSLVVASVQPVLSANLSKGLLRVESAVPTWASCTGTSLLIIFLFYGIYIRLYNEETSGEEMADQEGAEPSKKEATQMDGNEQDEGVNAMQLLEQHYGEAIARSRPVRFIHGFICIRYAEITSGLLI